MAFGQNSTIFMPKNPIFVRKPSHCYESPFGSSPNPRPPPFPEEPGLPLHTGKQPVPSALRSDSVHQGPASRARLGQHQRNRMCSLQFIRFSQFGASASLIITHIFRIITMNSFVKLKATTKPRFPRTFSQSENASEIQTPREIPPIGVSHGRIYRTPSHTWRFQERPTATQTLVGRTYK